MDIKELQTFVEIADAGGISPAAARLGVSKSVVSRRLNRLEADLGVQLLSRSTRGVALTDAGVLFREHAMKVCKEIKHAIEMALPVGQLRGRLRIAAAVSFSPCYFAPALAEMARRNPALHIQTCYSDRLADLIADGYDCAIALDCVDDVTLISQRIGSIPGSAVASPAYLDTHGFPEHPAQLPAHEALMLGSETWQFVDGDDIVAICPRGRFKADHGAALAAAAVAGLGIAYVPTQLIEEQLKSGTLVQVMPRFPPPPSTVYLVVPTDQPPSQKIRALGDLLAAYLATAAPFSGC